MNKFYLLALSLIAAMPMEAATYYLYGTFNEWKSGVTFTASQDTWEYVAKNVKLSQTSGSSWDSFQIRIVHSDGTTNYIKSNGYEVSPIDSYSQSTNWTSVKQQDTGGSNIALSGCTADMTYDFYYHPNDNYVQVVKSGSALPDVDTANGEFYLVGLTDEPVKMTLNSGSEFKTSKIVPEIENGSVSIVYKKDGQELIYYGADAAGSQLYTSAHYFVGSAADMYHVSPMVTSFTSPNGYTFYFDPLRTQDGVVSPHLWVEVSEPITGPFYFYSDMNRWSCLKWNGADPDETVSVTKVDGKTDISASVFEPYYGSEKSNWPKYYTADEIKSTWQFKPVDEDHPVPAVDGIKGNADTWYYLDFKNMVDQHGNTGRLCGQFKITKGDRGGDDNWGPMLGSTSGDDNIKGYLQNYITVGQVYGRESGDGVDRRGFGKGSGRQNFQLNCSYVEDAVIYFNPNDMQIVITGTERRIYAIYGRLDGDRNEAPEAPEDWYIADLSQKNYYANSNGFNSGALTANGAGKDETYNFDSMYYWEEITDHDYNGITLGKAWRRLIPYGATDRFPVPFFVSVTGADGSWMSEQQVECDNLYFLDADDINVYFRYADDRDLSWVGYNLFKNDHDKQTGAIRARIFAYGEPSEVTFYTEGSTDVNPAQNNGMWVKAQRTEELVDGHYWWKSPESVPAGYVYGAYAIFHVSDRTYHPYAGIQSQEGVLDRGKLQAEDLYYVIDTNGDMLHILYSHLNGTYQIGSRHAENILQINAELFDETGTLDTTYKSNDIRYAFEVYAGGEMLASKPLGPEPFLDLDINGMITADSALGAGFELQVVVLASKDGVQYVSTDTYTIFPSQE